MANNREMYCRHCGKNTLFILESDRLWYCDECENVYGSIPDDEIEDEDFWDEEVGDVIRCPFCNNLIETEELVDECLCPICFEDLSDKLEENDEE